MGFFFRQLPIVFVAVLTQPVALFEQKRDDDGYGFPLFFAVMMMTLGAVLGSWVGGDSGVQVTAGGGLIGAIIGGSIFGVVVAFVLGAVVHGLAKLAGGSAGFQSSFQVVAYSMATVPIANLFGAIPILSAVPALYGLVLLGLGVAVMHDVERLRAMAAVTGGLVVLMGVMIGLTFMSANRLMKNLDEDRAAFMAALPPRPAPAPVAVAVAPVIPTPVPTPTPAPPEPSLGPGLPEVVTLAVSLSSTPPGARVFRLADQKELGTTPMIWKTRMGDPPMALRFSLAGYKDELRELNGDLQSELSVLFKR